MAGFKLKPFKPEEKPKIARAKTWGTGLDKETALRAAREAEKRAQEQSVLQQTRQEEIESVVDLDLPTTLMPDDIQLDESQQTAVDCLVNQQFGCLIGAAGTGKTTTIKALVHSILQSTPNPHIAFCSFTGRAVQQIKRALPREYHSHCDTIHGLLEYAPESVEYVADSGETKVKKIFKPRRTEFNLLDQNIIIVDEGGMTPIDLWNNLMRACRPNTRVYLIGDINQLPPVQGRSVLGFAMLNWPTFELNRIHRTDEDAITDNAWRILHGKAPQNANGKVALKQISDDSMKALLETTAVIQRLSKNDIFHALRDALIVPQNVGNIGQTHLNERLVNWFNPPHKIDNVCVNPRTIVTAGYEHHSFAVGDKLMVTQNDREQGLTNGMIGVLESLIPNPEFRGEIVGDMAAASMAADYELDLTEIDDALSEAQKQEEKESEREKQASHIMKVKFQNVDEPIEFSTAGAINSLKLAYAFTCHKAQGGEYHTVVILLHSANIRMLSREWLYTAWTRAQAKIVLLYNPRGLKLALNRQWIKGKSIQEKAEAFNKLQESNKTNGDVKVPILPAATEIQTNG